MFYSTGGRNESNVVAGFHLPVPNLSGEVSLSKSFESPPTAGITYTGCSRSKAAAIVAAYRAGNRITLAGIPFAVRGVTRSRTMFFEALGRSIGEDSVDMTVELEWYYASAISREIEIIVSPGVSTISLARIAAEAGVPVYGMSYLFDTATLNPTRVANRRTAVRVSLDGMARDVARLRGCFLRYDRGIGAVPIRSGGRGWNLADRLISSERVETTVLPAYSNSPLSWDGQENIDDPAGAPRFGLAEPKIVVLEKTTEDLMMPPADTTHLEGLDSNAHRSGPKKTRTVTTTIDGAPDTVEIETWGFAYNGDDIAVYDDRGSFVTLFSQSPANFWKVVETRVQKYEYDKSAAVTLRATATDPAFPARRLNFFLHPDYNGVGGVRVSGNTITFTPKTEYLIGSTTTGRKWIPLRDESDSGEPETVSLDPGDERESYRFRWVPLNGREKILLESARAVADKFKKPGAKSDDGIPLPFTVEWYDYIGLPPRLKARLPRSAATIDGKIGVVIPSLDHVEPYYAVEEASIVISFAWAPNPEDPDLPALKTGEESTTRVRREVTAIDRYTEISENFSAQNPGFLDMAESATIEEKTGTPPGATTRGGRWEEREPIPTGKPKERTNYVLYSTPASFTSPVIGSVNASLAKNLDEAMTVARANLIVDCLNASRSNKKIAWFYPEIDPGDTVDGEFVMSVSVSVNHDGGINQCDGTSIGCARRPSVSVTVQPVFIPEELSGDTPTVTVDTIGVSKKTIGDISMALPNRRDFKN